MVWVEINITLSRLEHVCHHCCNNKHTYKVIKWQWLIIITAVSGDLTKRSIFKRISIKLKIG